jgi:hypothetical protein
MPPRELRIVLDDRTRRVLVDHVVESLRGSFHGPDAIHAGIRDLAERIVCEWAETRRVEQQDQQGRG